ncbi:MAG: hypothetical protein WEB59_00030 [Thermoanaerobaculia bacterium]
MGREFRAHVLADDFFTGLQQQVSSFSPVSVQTSLPSFSTQQHFSMIFAFFSQ